jgi:hypothetical protein
MSFPMGRIEPSFESRARLKAALTVLGLQPSLIFYITKVAERGD